MESKAPTSSQKTRLDSLLTLFLNLLIDALKIKSLISLTLTLSGRCCYHYFVKVIAKSEKIK